MRRYLKKTTTATVLSMALVMSACGNTGSGDGVPEITGVSDQVVQAKTSINVMDGIAANDKEDGDLTGKISVEATPALDFVNGVATPEKAGEYELTYTVTDKDGHVANEYATLTVTKQTGEMEVYKAFDFAKESAIDNHGWEAHITDGVDASASLSKGAYVFEIKNPGEGDGDISLVKNSMEVKAANYKVKIWAKASEKTYCHLLAVDANATEWKTFGGAYNVVIDEDVAPIEMDFTVEQDSLANICLNLGKITPNPDNPDDTTPENFDVTIDKIEIYEITGNETKVPVYTCDFSTEDAVSVEASDGAEALVEIANEAVVSVSSYPTEGGVWSIKTNIGIGDEAIEAGSKYYYSFDLTADAAQSGECLVESASLYDQARANFSNFSVEAGETVTVSGTFVAENAVSDPVIRLQMGNPSEGVTENTLTISNVTFGQVTGDLSVSKTIDMFASYGACSGSGTDALIPFTTYNGTDEDNETGVGTIYNEDGKLYYRIDQGGVTDWHNKLICGYGDNPLVLAADNYYTVEITCKADKDVSCSFFLNPMGSWDPRIAEGMDITTEEQTFTFTTTDTFVTDMNFEMLFQFGSEATSKLGDVTIEFSNITIYSQSVLD